MAHLIAHSADTAHELGHVASLHLRRLAGILTVAAGDVGSEVQGMIWNCRDVLATNRAFGREVPDAPRDTVIGLLQPSATPRTAGPGN